MVVSLEGHFGVRKNTGKRRAKVLLGSPRPDMLSLNHEAARMRETTPIIVILIPLVLGALDVFLYWVGGNDATISRVMLGVRYKYPLAALSTAYTLGVFLGHLYFPRTALEGPSTREVLGRMMVALSPAFYSLIVTSEGGANEAHKRALESGGQLVFAAWMLLAIICGGLVGALVLAQHVTPIGGDEV